MLVLIPSDRRGWPQVTCPNNSEQRGGKKQKRTDSPQDTGNTGAIPPKLPVPGTRTDTNTQTGKFNAWVLGSPFFSFFVWQVDHGGYRFSGTMPTNQQPEMTLNLTKHSPTDRVLDIAAELSFRLGTHQWARPGCVWAQGLA